MTPFDAEKFEDKYKHYFTELQQAYRNAFEEMEQRYDSDIVHYIDQHLLAESEPFYDGNGRFRVELSNDTEQQVEDEDMSEILEEYIQVLEEQIAAEFEFQ